MPRVLSASQLVAESLLEAATEFRAQLIVSGGYGHARLQEWALGRVTRDLLDQQDKFVLLSH